MNNNNHTQLDINVLLNLNRFIQRKRKDFEYHMKHIRLAEKYALLLVDKLGTHIDPIEMSFIALSHDLFKDKGLHPSHDGKVSWNGHNIPQDLNRYVRLNLDILDKFDLTDYFNTDINLHALAAGIFIVKELGIDDPKLLYPIFFHSCPIMEVYNKLDDNVKEIINIMILADKLSSNYLRINEYSIPVRVDLDKIVFGESGKEFNYTLGLYIARLISQGNTPDKQSKITTEYYRKKVNDMNPLISDKFTVKKLGGIKIWPERKSQVWQNQ